MLDDKPQNVYDDAGWFRHFRMTKYLPAIADKFDKAMVEHAEDGKATKAVMTAYSAAALDILMHINTPAKDYAAALADTFAMTADHLLLLNTDDFARLAQRSKITVHETLSQAGFLVDNDIVVGFRLPQDAPRPKPPVKAGTAPQKPPTP